jgi:hypothetical protein
MTQAVQSPLSKRQPQVQSLVPQKQKKENESSLV